MFWTKKDEKKGDFWLSIDSNMLDKGLRILTKLDDFFLICAGACCIQHHTPFRIWISIAFFYSFNFPYVYFLLYLTITQLYNVLKNQSFIFPIPNWLLEMLINENHILGKENACSFSSDKLYSQDVSTLNYFFGKIKLLFPCFMLPVWDI